LTLRLPLSHPYKAPLLASLGQAGVVTSLEELGFGDEEVINYAKGFVPLGPEEDGRVPGIGTTGANPFATISQLGEFVATLAAGRPGEAWEVMPVSTRSCRSHSRRCQEPAGVATTRGPTALA
jgi:hypothetical protein